MALDLAEQVRAISQFAQTLGIPDDLIKRMRGSFFHYTDYNGFAGIVMKKDIWLTDARCSNDGQEIEHGRTRIEQLIEDRAKRGKIKKARLLAEEVIDALKSEANTEQKVDVEGQKSAADAVYVCCFCKDQGDLLSQWRGYAANGGGVAIEIEPNGFHWLAGADNTAGVMRFWRVYYTDREKSEIVEQILGFWANQPIQQAARVESAVATFKFFVPTFKNASFSEETEWRLIFTPEPSCNFLPKFRTARGLLVPYFELAELAGSGGGDRRAVLDIVSVRIGPGPYQDVNARSARMLLDNYGFQRAQVSLSEIPFRG